VLWGDRELYNNGGQQCDRCHAVNCPGVLHRWQAATWRTLHYRSLGNFIVMWWMLRCRSPESFVVMVYRRDFFFSYLTLHLVSVASRVFKAFSASSCAQQMMIHVMSTSARERGRKISRRREENAPIERRHWLLLLETSWKKRGSFASTKLQRCCYYHMKKKNMRPRHCIHQDILMVVIVAAISIDQTFPRITMRESGFNKFPSLFT